MSEKMQKITMYVPGNLKDAGRFAITAGYAMLRGRRAWETSSDKFTKYWYVENVTHD